MEYLRTEVRDGVAVLTLSDPGRRNALNATMNDEIATALDEIEARDDVGAVVITGAPPAFCAGADLSHLADSAAGDPKAGLREAYAGFLRVGRCPLPTIAAVNGAAVGAGMNMALVTDLRLASIEARFDCRFLKLGIHPGGGHTWMLQRAVGHQKAAAMLLLGEVLDGTTAASWGLVHECVDADRLLERAVELGSGAAGVPGELLRKTTASLRSAYSLPGHDQAVELELEPQAWSMVQPEFADRLRAMQEKISSR